MRHAVLVAIFLLGCFDSTRDPRWAYAPHYATSWTVTQGGVMRDAGPFGSVLAGYTSDAEIDAALDLAHADFIARFPEFSWVNPAVHLTDDYAFWVSMPGAWASGMTVKGAIALALWTRLETAGEPPDGTVWIKRPPGEAFGQYYATWRQTALRLVPAYQHECLHIAIHDPTHVSPLWGRL